MKLISVSALAYAESLETVGFLRFKDGTARPAWTTFLSHL
jgi:hypothetical protein